MPEKTEKEREARREDHEHLSLSAFMACLESTFSLSLLLLPVPTQRRMLTYLSLSFCRKGRYQDREQDRFTPSLSQRFSTRLHFHLSETIEFCALLSKRFETARPPTMRSDKGLVYLASYPGGRGGRPVGRTWRVLWTLTARRRGGDS